MKLKLVKSRSAQTGAKQADCSHRNFSFFFLKHYAGGRSVGRKDRKRTSPTRADGTVRLIRTATDGHLRAHSHSHPSLRLARAGAFARTHVRAHTIGGLPSPMPAPAGPARAGRAKGRPRPSTPSSLPVSSPFHVPSAFASLLHKHGNSGRARSRARALAGRSARTFNSIRGCISVVASCLYAGRRAKRGSNPQARLRQTCRLD